MKAPKLVRDLFPEDGDTRFAVRYYCATCVALRLVGVGWEPQINAYNARDMVLLASVMPEHSRPALLADAGIKARNEGDAAVLRLLGLSEAA